jgi:prevent-host-death family protein
MVNSNWSTVPVMAKHLTVGVSEFKAHCLRLLDEVARRRVRITVTKRGRPVATIHPAHASQPSSYGALKGTVTIVGDIMEPLGETWNAEVD